MPLSDRSNNEWIRELQLAPPQCDAAIQDLRSRLVRGLKAAFGQDKRLDMDSIEDFAQEALARILSEIASFRGESRFITWAMKVATNLTITALRRKHWKDVSLEKLTLPEQFIDSSRMTAMVKNPEKRALQKMMMESLNQIISQDLSERQRKAMFAIQMRGMPLQEVADRMGTNRNSLYKLMHDARKRLKQALLEKGLSLAEMMDVFE